MSIIFFNQSLWKLRIFRCLRIIIFNIFNIMEFLLLRFSLILRNVLFDPILDNRKNFLISVHSFWNCQKIKHWKKIPVFYIIFVLDLDFLCTFNHSNFLALAGGKLRLRIFQWFGLLAVAYLSVFKPSLLTDLAILKFGPDFLLASCKKKQIKCFFLRICR